MKKILKSFTLASIIMLNLVLITNGFISSRKTNEFSQNDPINPRPEVISNIRCSNDPINPRPEIITEFYCVNDPINPKPEISTLIFS